MLRFIFFFLFFFSFCSIKTITDNLFDFSFFFIESLQINHFETYSLLKHIYRWEKAQIAKSNNSNDNNYGTSSMSSATQPVNEGTQNNRFHSVSDDVTSFGSAPKHGDGSSNPFLEENQHKGCQKHSFCRALGISGVFEFAMALFFAKFVAYMFIYWLPYYLGHLKFSTDEGKYSSEESGTRMEHSSYRHSDFYDLITL